MTRPPFEVGDIFRTHWETFLQEHSASPQQCLVSRALQQCRTAALGGHAEKCDECGHERIAYNSCRNRNCPKCQSLARARWLEERKAELLPVHYFHVVFTVPDTIAAVSMHNQRVVYGILFAAVNDTLRTIAADSRHLGAEIGFLSVLHTWGQNLLHHPHIHCVVPGGGLSLDGRRWVRARKKFFLPVRVLSRFFRHTFLAKLADAFEAGELEFFGAQAHLAEADAFRSWLNSHRKTEWVVYAKRPFGGPEQVLEYLGRYTHRIAISNHRLVDVGPTHVSFRWKDYRNGHGVRTMNLHPHEFMRRFLLHALPRHFVRLRYGGFLANRHRRQKIELCRELLAVRSPARPHTPHLAMDWRERYELLTGQPIDLCPVCSTGRMVVVTFLLPFRAHKPPRMDSS